MISILQSRRNAKKLKESRRNSREREGTQKNSRKPEGTRSQRDSKEREGTRMDPKELKAEGTRRDSIPFVKGMNGFVHVPRCTPAGNIPPFFHPLPSPPLSSSAAFHFRHSLPPLPTFVIRRFLVAFYAVPRFRGSRLHGTFFFFYFFLRRTMDRNGAVLCNLSRMQTFTDAICHECKLSRLRSLTNAEPNATKLRSESGMSQAGNSGEQAKPIGKRNWG